MLGDIIGAGVTGVIGIETARMVARSAKGGGRRKGGKRKKKS